MASGALNGKALVVIAAGVGVYALREATSVLVPFFLALFLYYVAEPAVRKLASWRIPRGAAIALVALFLAGLFALAFLVLRQGLSGLGENAPQYEERLLELRDRAAERFGIRPSEHAKPLAEEAGKSLNTIAATALGGIATLVFDTVLVFAYLIFMLRAAPYARRRWAALWPGRTEQVARTTEEIEEHMIRYVGLQTAISAANGLAAWAILTGYGVELAPLWSLLIFLSQYIPTIGPMVASLPPILMAMVQGSPGTTAWVALWLFIVQFASGYFVEPRVFGKGMQLDPVAVLFGLVFFGWLWGVFGAFLAVPMLVAIKAIADRVPSLKGVSAMLEDPVPE